MPRTSIRGAQELVNKLTKDQNWKTDSSTIFNHLVEEIGEVARELRKSDSKENLSQELGDVLFLLFKLANELHIDTEKAFIKKFALIKERFE